MPDQENRTAETWIAVLADSTGFVYESVEDARENAEDPEREAFEVSVRRGTAAAIRPAGDRGRLPGNYLSGDIAYELDDVWLDDEDETVGVAVRYAQAQAMAAGLNAVTVEITDNLVDTWLEVTTDEPAPSREDVHTGLRAAFEAAGIRVAS